MEGSRGQMNPGRGAGAVLVGGRRKEPIELGRGTEVGGKLRELLCGRCAPYLCGKQSWW